MAIRIQNSRYTERMVEDIKMPELDVLKLAVEKDFQRSLEANKNLLDGYSNFSVDSSLEFKESFDETWEEVLALHEKAKADPDNYRIVKFCDNQADDEHLLCLDIYEKVDIGQWGLHWVCKNPWRAPSLDGDKSYVNSPDFTKNYLYHMRISGFDRFVWLVGYTKFGIEGSPTKQEKKSPEYEWLMKMIDNDEADVMAWQVVPNIIKASFSVKLVPISQANVLLEKAQIKTEKARRLVLKRARDPVVVPPDPLPPLDFVLDEGTEVYQEQEQVDEDGNGTGPGRIKRA